MTLCTDEKQNFINRYLNLDFTLPVLSRMMNCKTTCRGLLMKSTVCQKDMKKVTKSHSTEKM